MSLKLPVAIPVWIESAVYVLTLLIVTKYGTEATYFGTWFQDISVCNGVEGMLERAAQPGLQEQEVVSLLSP